MTIKELIIELQKYPDDINVVDYGGNYISTIELDNRYLYQIDDEVKQCLMIG